MVKIIREMFTPETHQDLYKVFEWELNWKRSNVSESGDGQKFWYADGGEHPFISEAIRDAVNPVLAGALGVENIAFERFYCNGQSFGEDGSPHSDYQEDGMYSLLYFPMLEWKKEWGGEFLIYDENEDILLAWWPRPNSAILFNSNLKHVGKSPVKSCLSIRYSLAIAINTNV
jgi:hypothetical protein